MQHDVSGRRWRYRRHFLISLVFAATSIVCAQTRGESVLLEHSMSIISAARTFNIDPRLLAAIVYTEQSYNFKPGEAVIDYVFALSGYNSSIGIAQLKVRTAMWIEQNIHNPASRFYLGEKLSAVLPHSKNKYALIENLRDPKINLLYASAYIAILSKIWSSVLPSFRDRAMRASIIATLYSRGGVREPHLNPKSNAFGKKAEEFYNSFWLGREIGAGE
jgi:hypothetical protein